MGIKARREFRIAIRAAKVSDNLEVCRIAQALLNLESRLIPEPVRHKSQRVFDSDGTALNPISHFSCSALGRKL